MAPLRIATRGSRLALWQAERVATLLGGGAELVVVSTTGDQRTDVPISTIGGTGVFVKEVEQAVLDGRADLAVHSAKDLPSETAEGLVLAAVPERADPRDALVGARLDAIQPGADQGVAGIGPLGHGRQPQPLGRLRREVLGRVDGQVGPPVEHRLLDLLDEHARPPHGPDGDVGALIAGGGHDDELGVAAEEGGDPLGLPQGETAAPGGDSQRHP